jgi:hypothetical protein
MDDSAANEHPSNKGARRNAFLLGNRGNRNQEVQIDLP